MPRQKPKPHIVVTCSQPEHEHNGEKSLYTYRGSAQNLSGTIDFTSLSQIVRAIKVRFRRLRSVRNECSFVFFLDGTEGKDELQFTLSLPAPLETAEIQDLVRTNLNHWCGIIES